MDIDAIAPGTDFVQVIDDALTGCDVVLVVIGRSWLSITGPDGTSRLDRSEDFVRLEIEGALARGLRVMPVLVGGASMPSVGELPQSIASLARRHAIELSDRSWHADVRSLLLALGRPPKKIWSSPPPAVQSPDRGTEPTPSAPGERLEQVEESQGGRPPEARPQRGRWLRGALVAAFCGGVAAVVITVVLVGRGATPPRSSQRQGTTTSTTSPGKGVSTTGWVVEQTGMSNEQLHDVACVDVMDCVATTIGVIWSGDGGQTWGTSSTYHVDHPDTSSYDLVTLLGVTCPPGDVKCISVGEGLRFGSTAPQGPVVGVGHADGTDWAVHRIHVPDAVGSIACLSTLESSCVAVGLKGITVKTTDFGSTWGTPVFPTHELLGGVACTGEDTCVAVGDKGTIVVTKDGGSAWRAVTSHTTANLRGITCASEAHCIATGAGGVVLVSNDAGSSWTTVKSGTTNGLVSVACATAVACAAVGDGSTVLLSANGGETWVNDPPNSPETALSGVTCPTATECVAVGTGLVVLRGSILP